MPAEATATTDDRLLGGRVICRQPATGYRVAIDTVLVAAAVSATPGDAVLELGSGVGAASLCLAARVPGLAIDGLEADAGLAALANDNAAANGWAGRVRFVAGDVRAAPFAPATFDQIFANPPYLEPARADRRASSTAAVATIEGTAPLAGWIVAMATLVRPGGGLTLIHRADRLDALLAALAGAFGGIVVCPLWPRPGAPARRVIVGARRGVATPLRLSAGLVLHDDAGAYSAAAAAILRDGAPLDL